MINYHVNLSDDLNLVDLVTTLKLWSAVAAVHFQCLAAGLAPSAAESDNFQANDGCQDSAPLAARSPYRCVSTREALKHSPARLLPVRQHFAPSLSNMLQPNNNLDLVIIIPTHRLARLPSNAKTEAS